MGAGIHSEAVPFTLEGFLGARQPDRHQCGQNQEGEFFHDVFPLVGGAKRGKNADSFAANARRTLYTKIAESQSFLNFSARPPKPL